MMPMVKKLIRYATKAGQWLPSWCSNRPWPGPATDRFSASSVIATANTPSLKASSRDRSTRHLLPRRSLACQSFGGPHERTPGRISRGSCRDWRRVARARVRLPAARRLVRRGLATVGLRLGLATAGLRRGLGAAGLRLGLAALGGPGPTQLTDHLFAPLGKVGVRVTNPVADFCRGQPPGLPLQLRDLRTGIKVLQFRAHSLVGGIGDANPRMNELAGLVERGLALLAHGLAILSDIYACTHDALLSSRPSPHARVGGDAAVALSAVAFSFIVNSTACNCKRCSKHSL